MVDVFDSSKKWVEFSPYAKALVVIVMIVLILVATYLFQHPPLNTNIVTKRGGANNEIIFPCNYNPCGPILGIFVVENSQVSHMVSVNATYSCNCNATVIFIYSPQITRSYVDNSTTIVQVPHALPAGQNMTIAGYATRYSGTDSITVTITTVLIP